MKKILLSAVLIAAGYFLFLGGEYTFLDLWRLDRAQETERAELEALLAQAEVDDGTRPGITSEESAEVKRLKAENKRLREDNEILRRASIFFAGELDPRNR